MDAAAFLLPLGPVNPAHFPLTDKERKAHADGEPSAYADEDAKAAALVDAWIAQAQAKHAGEAAVQELYVLARAQAAAYATVLANPASGSTAGEASYAYSTAQINGLRDAAAAAEAAYADAAAALVAAPAVVRRAPTGTIQAGACWS